MSVIMTLVVPADPSAVESTFQNDPDKIDRIMEAAKSHGVIGHRFYGSGNKVMVIDEWPDEASFRAFFSEMEHEIGPVMQAVAQGEPEITIWTKLDTRDDYGWDA
jgi:heme-degrading monooxygenase HmoA